MTTNGHKSNDHQAKPPKQPKQKGKRRVKPNRPLSERVKAFCYAWVALCAEGNENRAEAARRAGYTGRLTTLSTQGTRILANPKAKDLIRSLTKEALTIPIGKKPLLRFRYIMGVGEILATTTFLARATLDDVLDGEGKFDIAKARETGGIHALKRVKTRTFRRQYKDGTYDETVTHEVELRDKNGSLELMGRHFQLWDDDEDPDAEAKRLLEEEKARSAAEQVERLTEIAENSLPLKRASLAQGR